MSPVEAFAACAEDALSPLDELRQLALRLAASWPWGRTLARRRSVRVPVLLTVHALAAFALAVIAPSFLLVVAPLVLGVPHLAADVRHLLIRRAWPRWWLVASAGFAAMLIAARALSEADARFKSLAVEQGIAAAWIVLGAAAGALAARPRSRGWLVVAAALALAGWAIGAPLKFRMVLLQGHNLFAVALWLLLFRRGRLAWIAAAVVLTGAALLASGVLIPLTVAHGWLSVAGLHIFAAADWLAPGLPDRLAIGLAMSFAFLQSVHYLIWLVAIPAGDRPGEGGRAWRVAWRELVRDLRPTGVTVVVALAALVAWGGWADPGLTRRLFLSLGTFHAWLELAVLAFILGRGAARPAAGSTPP